MITVCKRYCKLLHPSVSKTSDLTNNYKKKTDGKRSVRKGEPMSFIQKNTKGILLCLVLAIPCWFLGQAVPVVGGPVFGILAGMLIIPAIFVFSGIDGMSAGPSLMFVALPKTFYTMGKAGYVIGLVFFLLTAFAALTSCISVLEAITANCMEVFHTERKKTTGVLTIIYLIATAVIALGYSVFYVEVKLPNGSTGQLLDIMDYISNSFLMPLISVFSTILVGWIVGSKWIAEEMEHPNGKFSRKHLYNIMIKYVAPVIMVILFLQSTGLLDRLLAVVA